MFSMCEALGSTPPQPVLAEHGIERIYRDSKRWVSSSYREGFRKKVRESCSRHKKEQVIIAGA